MNEPMQVSPPNTCESNIHDADQHLVEETTENSSPLPSSINAYQVAVSDQGLKPHDRVSNCASIKTQLIGSMLWETW
jgi:hypothetical protein